jgi:alanine-glyoxylate transaminase/serine-glyoxylate transaminase/serine-pyruvate transaminase
LVADCIASLGCDEFRMDAWGVDVALAASQKGLMTPPGLAILWISERARGAADRADLVTPYWDWRPRTAPAEYWHYFCGTAPTHHLYGLSAALGMIEDEGIAAVWARHERLAQGVWAAVGAWGQGGDIALNLADPAARGRSVTSVRMGGGAAGRLRAWTEAGAGVTLGIGLGMATAADPGADDWLRIAHMGHVNAHMTLGVIGVVEAGLTALQVPHGGGAVEAAARVMI